MKQLPKNTAFALLCAGLPTAMAQAQGPTLDPSFVPTVALPAQTGQVLLLAINDVVRQPDGKLIVAGSFSQINNVAVSYLCRLLPNGQVDATFATAGPNATVRSVALQPDGKLVIGGDFSSVGGQPRSSLARLLPNGTLDASFSSPFRPLTGRPASVVNKVVLQPGTGILVLGGLNTTAAPASFDARLVRVSETTGALDPGFQRVPDTVPNVFDVLVQPNGHLVLAGQPRPFGGQRCTVWGTLPNGAPDPAFVPLPDTTSARTLARDPATGNIYADANDASGVVGDGPVRLRPNGTLDPAFNASGAFGPGGSQGNIRSLAVQPNGRLLLGGNIYDGSRSYGTWRLMPNGTRDGSYQPGNGPVVNSETVYKVLVQPDGALVFGGTFNLVGSSARDGLARMLDPNVLSARAPDQPAADELTAWPVPAHDALHLRLPAGRPPRQAQLLDALGRVVRRQALAPAELAPALPTAGLPPGGYLLRVDFGQGPPAYRRVVLE